MHQVKHTSVSTDISMKNIAAPQRTTLNDHASELKPQKYTEHLMCAWNHSEVKATRSPLGTSERRKRHSTRCSLLRCLLLVATKNYESVSHMCLRVVCFARYTSLLSKPKLLQRTTHAGVASSRKIQLSQQCRPWFCRKLSEEKQAKAHSCRLICIVSVKKNCYTVSTPKWHSQLIIRLGQRQL